MQYTIGSKIRLLKDVWDNGDENHHPPGYLARRGEIVMVRSVHADGQVNTASHEHILDNAFHVYAGEYEPAH